MPIVPDEYFNFLDISVKLLPRQTIVLLLHALNSIATFPCTDISEKVNDKLLSLVLYFLSNLPTLKKAFCCLSIRAKS